MNMFNLPAIFAAMFLGFLSGGLLLLGLGTLPFWQSLDPAEFTKLFSANLPFNAGAMKPLGFSSVAVVLFATGLAMWQKLPTKKWLIASSALALCMFSTYPLYFAETNAVLAEGTMSAANIAHGLETWQQVHWFRTIAAILACFFAVFAGYAGYPKTDNEI